MNGALPAAGTAGRGWRGVSGLIAGLIAAPPLADLALALVLTGLVQAESDYRGVAGIRVAALLTTVPLAWRRRWPLPAFVVAFASLLVIARYDSPWWAIAAILVAAYSVGLYCRNRLLSLGAAVGAATAVDVIFGGGHLPSLPDVAVPFVLLGAVWLVGDAMRTRELRADALADKAARLEREREEATRAALAAERRRLARELHDVVTHSVSVMVVQAGAARQILATSPERAGAALLAVEAGGREALTELRHLLGLLDQDDGEAAELAPQPGVAQLAALVRRVGAAGLPVTLRVAGEPCPLPPGLDLAVYRIVQEALTNAIKHADRARTEATLDYGEDELRVEIRDDGPGVAGAGGAVGRGLIGLRERVALYGGTLEAGPRPGGGYAVRARLPLERGWP